MTFNYKDVKTILDNMELVNAFLKDSNNPNIVGKMEKAGIPTSEYRVRAMLSAYAASLTMKAQRYIELNENRRRSRETQRLYRQLTAKGLNPHDKEKLLEGAAILDNKEAVNAFVSNCAIDNTMRELGIRPDKKHIESMQMLICRRAKNAAKNKARRRQRRTHNGIAKPQDKARRQQRHTREEEEELQFEFATDDGDNMVS